MIKLKFYLSELIEQLPEIDYVFKNIISGEDESLYPNIKELNELKMAFLLDSFFKALDDCLLQPKTGASSSHLRNLIKHIAYDSELYPRFDDCVYDYIHRGISFQKINQSKKEDNIITKEIAFVDNLMSKLMNLDKKITWIVAMFLLYEFNKRAHFLDSIFRLIYKKTFSFYPNIFVLLNKVKKSDVPFQNDRFISVTETICSMWSNYIYKNLYTRISIDQKSNAKDIISCLMEMQSLPCVQGFCKDAFEIQLIVDCWKKTKEELELFSTSSIDVCYYRLISTQMGENELIANLSPSTQKIIMEEVENHPFRVASMKCRDQYLRNRFSDRDIFDFEQMIGEDIIESEEERQWKNYNHRENRFQYNPFSPSIPTDIISTAMTFQNDCGKGSFGCPLRIFQLSVGEIENILFDVLSVYEIRRCRESLLAERILYDNPKLPYDERKRLLQDWSLQYREIRNEEKSALKELEEYPRAFYQGLSHDERYISWLIDVIPFEKRIDKISPFAIKDGYLHIVYRQSMKRWFSILKLFCKISYGKNALSNGDAILQCFATGCHGNREHYCHKRLSKILNELNAVPFPTIDIP